MGFSVEEGVEERGCMDRDGREDLVYGLCHLWRGR